MTGSTASVAKAQKISKITVMICFVQEGKHKGCGVLPRALGHGSQGSLEGGDVLDRRVKKVSVVINTATSIVYPIC